MYELERRVFAANKKASDRWSHRETILDGSEGWTSIFANVSHFNPGHLHVWVVGLGGCSKQAGWLRGLALDFCECLAL